MVQMGFTPENSIIALELNKYSRRASVEVAEKLATLEDAPLFAPLMQKKDGGKKGKKKSKKTTKHTKKKVKKQVKKQVKNKFLY